LAISGSTERSSQFSLKMAGFLDEAVGRDAEGVAADLDVADQPGRDGGEKTDAATAGEHRAASGESEGEEDEDGEDQDSEGE
jgi:hypothetical protein